MKSNPKSPSPAASTATRQTSDRASTAASKIMALIRDGAVFEWYEPTSGEYVDGTHLVKRVLAGHPRKQSSSKVSTLAARILKMTEDANPKWCVSYTTDDLDLDDFASVAQIRSLCASVLSQDETKGQRPLKRKRGKGRK